MTEETLDNFMEDCLSTRDYKMMYKTLERIEGTYSKFDSYMKQAKALEVSYLKIEEWVKEL